jgi:hypothetical protein
MTSPLFPDKQTRTDHEMWVRSRLQLDAEFQDALRHGFTLITTGFGSFAIFDGLATMHRGDEVPKAFALAATAIGMIVILLAGIHLRKMTAWVDGDEFGTASVPRLPDENRSLYLAVAAIVIGAVSFIALLRLP